MWFRIPALLAIMISAPACFVLEELDAGADSMKISRSKDSKSGDSASEKPADYTSELQGWWGKARTLGTETQDKSIRRCDLGGRISLMREDDCRSRGGFTSPSG